MPLCLTKQELQDLTQRERYSAQVRALRSMGIEHRIRPDGSVAVLRAHIIEVFGAPMPSSAKTDIQEPDWDAL